MTRTTAPPGTPSARAKLFINGRSQAVRLPKQFRLPGNEVSIRKEGNAVVLEPMAKRKWPPGYWQRLTRRAKDLELGRVVPLGGRLLDLAADDV
jgi:virulence-associated protein VagC